MPDSTPAPPIKFSHGLKGSHAFITAGHEADAASTTDTTTSTEAGSLPLLPGETESKGSGLLCLHVDVTDPNSLATVFMRATATFGFPNIVVTLAGLDLSVLPKTSIADMDPKAWMRTFEVNVGGTMMAVRQWLRGVRELVEKAQSGGSDAKRRLERGDFSAVLVGSESGHFGEGKRADYAASKSAVQGGLLKSPSADVPRVFSRARVNAVAPGPVDTDRFKQECKDDPHQLYEDAQATVVLRKPVPVEAVAKSILFLASENLSAHIHGQVLNVDSGKQGKLLWRKEELAKQE